LQVLFKNGILIEIKQKGDFFMKVELTDVTQNAELKIAKSGGISHDNEIDNLEDARELNKKFIDWGHGTPIEFASSTFYVEGISRSMLSQLSRHRHINLMVKSFRYTKTNDDLVIPDSVQKWTNNTIANQDALDQATSHVDWLYDQMVEDGVPKEDARMLKFMGEKTKLYIRANFREFRHIIKQRGLNNHAQWEIRKFAQEVLEYLYYEAPSCFFDLMEDYEENFLKEGDSNS